MKRSSEDREGGEEPRRRQDPPERERRVTAQEDHLDPSKRRKVAFDPVRLPAVSNVNDMKNRTLIYQASKLRESFLGKNKKIEDLENQLIGLKRRDEISEQDLIKLYRTFASIDEQIRRETFAEFGGYDHRKDTCKSTSQIRAMSTEERNRYFEHLKDNLENALKSYTRARRERTQEHKDLIEKLDKFYQEPKIRASGLNEELLKKCKDLSDKNSELMSELARLQSENHATVQAKAISDDQWQLDKKKIVELKNQMLDMQHTNDKLLYQISKFESRLAYTKEELNHVKASAAASGVSIAPSASPGPSSKDMKTESPGSPIDLSNKQVEELRLEKDELAELAARRLTELTESNKKVQSLAQELSRKNFEIAKFQNNKDPNIATAEQVLSSNEYKCLKKYYSAICKEYERLTKENEDLLTEKNHLMTIHEGRMQNMETEHQKVLKDVVASSDLHNVFYKVQHEAEILRFEYEALREEYSKTVKQVEWDELKASLNTARSMVVVQRNELLRLREAKREMADLRKKVREYKEREEKCLLVPIDEKEYSFNQEDSQRIFAEYEGIRREIQRMGRISRAEKEEALAGLKQEFRKELAELEKLKKENEQLRSDELCIQDELEEIGTAVEEEQERSAQLFSERKELEDRNLKMMNERMVQSQVVARMGDKMNAMQDKHKLEQANRQTLEHEKKAFEDAIAKLNEALHWKGNEVSRGHHNLEANRKHAIEVANQRDDLINKISSNEELMKKCEEQMAETARDMEKMTFREARHREELDSLRLQFDRAKKNEAMGVCGQSLTGDEVLEEANRQMKETLTCPSCKTRPKDCIMLKCYHLFCESCIRTMYESRQRKCPKCATPFGANDFHRVFI